MQDLVAIKQRHQSIKHLRDSNLDMESPYIVTTFGKIVVAWMYN